MEHAIQNLSSALRSNDDWGSETLSLEAWAARWSPIAELRAVHPRDASRRNPMLMAVQGPIAGMRFATGYQLFHHGRRQLTWQGGLISVQRVTEGSTAMEFDSRAYIQRPGYLAITDHLQTYRGSHHKVTGSEVFIPRSLLGIEDDQPIEPILISEDSLHGTLLSTEINLFFELAGAPHSQIPFNPNPLLHLIATVVARHRYPRSERAGWWRARNELIRNHIDSHLDDLTLLPAKICNMFNLSRATLYRMFEIDGGVRRYIQDRRLHAAIWDLADHGVQRGRLTEVAEKWGFSSNANFNRAVKTAFEMPPGALLGPQSLVIPSRQDSVLQHDPFHDWLRQMEQSARPSRSAIR